MSAFPSDPARFREAMSRVAGAVHIVTTDGKAGKAGLTATAMTSVSDAPPTLLVCLNRQSRSGASLVENGVFVVNTLHDGQEELANVFAGRRAAQGLERFSHGDWRPGEGGVPVLADALVAFECVVEEARPVASHMIVIGRIARVHLGADQPGLIYTHRHFGKV